MAPPDHNLELQHSDTGLKIRGACNNHDAYYWLVLNCFSICKITSPLCFNGAVFQNNMIYVFQRGKYFVKNWVKFWLKRCCILLKPWVDMNMYPRFQTRPNLTWCLMFHYQMCSHICSRYFPTILSVSVVTVLVLWRCVHTLLSPFIDSINCSINDPALFSSVLAFSTAVSSCRCVHASMSHIQEHWGLPLLRKSCTVPIIMLVWRDGCASWRISYQKHVLHGQETVLIFLLYHKIPDLPFVCGRVSGLRIQMRDLRFY